MPLRRYSLFFSGAGQAYNAADEDTYCSIAKMAEKVAADGGVKVRYEIEEEADNGFPQTLYMDLDTSLLRGLGWELIPNYKKMDGLKND